MAAFARPQKPERAEWLRESTPKPGVVIQKIARRVMHERKPPPVAAAFAAGPCSRLRRTAEAHTEIITPSGRYTSRRCNAARTSRFIFPFEAREPPLHEVGRITPLEVRVPIRLSISFSWQFFLSEHPFFSLTRPLLFMRACFCSSARGFAHVHHFSISWPPSSPPLRCTT
jgi:hypothetical protein